MNTEPPATMRVVFFIDILFCRKIINMIEELFFCYVYTFSVNYLSLNNFNYCFLFKKNIFLIKN